MFKTPMINHKFIYTILSDRWNTLPIIEKQTILRDKYLHLTARGFVTDVELKRVFGILAVSWRVSCL